MNLRTLPFEDILTDSFEVRCRIQSDVERVQAAVYRYGRRAGVRVSTRRVDPLTVAAFRSPDPTLREVAKDTFDALMEAADIARSELERAENVNRRLAS